MFPKNHLKHKKNINPSAHQQHCRPPIDREYLRAPTLEKNSCWFVLVHEKWIIMCSFFVSSCFFWCAWKVWCFFFGMFENRWILFHNFEIIHYLVEQNGGFDRAMTFLVRNNLVPKKKCSNWGWKTTLTLGEHDGPWKIYLRLQFWVQFLGK